jgi:hypothetical protein
MLMRKIPHDAQSNNRALRVFFKKNNVLSEIWSDSQSATVKSLDIDTPARHQLAS